ncbi:MAG: DUF1566 domain-containing protein [Gammaproteobacteria bacterium]|nr:MAG: DUF1566 domain-containing protein [Gammaproteobacteria bacterium]
MNRIRTSIALVLGAFSISSTHAALLGRLPLTPGGVDYQAYYDTVLDVTWLANANLAAITAFDVVGINPNGTMTWYTAQEWVAALSAASYLGAGDWRLPVVGPANGSGFNYSVSYNGSTDRFYNVSEQGTLYAGSTGSEMAHMFYNTLNNKGYCDPILSTALSCSVQPGWGLSSTAPFSNLQGRGSYWSGTTYAPVPSDAWDFDFVHGGQDGAGKGELAYVWAVRDGDIAPVPIPAAAWLFAGGLGVLGLVRRRQVP